MATQTGNGATTTSTTADDLVAQVETGARHPAGWQSNLFLAIAFSWALYQLYIATGLPYALAEATGLNFFLGTLQHARRIHLAFAMVLAAMAYPLLRSSPRHTIPIYDWLLAAAALVACFYAVVNYDDIANRSGSFNSTDIAIGALGLMVLGIGVYRSLGLPLLIVVAVFVAYVFFGAYSWVPETIRWKGASVGKALWHFWIQDEGVFGAPVAISASMIFLFVLFGSILEKAGAGNYFIKLAFSLLGHLRGGPAKAAVVASALSGVYSGSSIANVVTTGTFTIPLMKKTGFSAEKAGAVEVASSTNGQLTPPVMGAAAFLMAEFTGVPYTDLLKHALIPAVVSYIALVYIVHLEALKLGLKGLDKPSPTLSASARLLRVLGGMILTVVLFLAVYYLLDAIAKVFPGLTLTSVIVVCAIAYVVLLMIAARRPDLEVDDPNAELKTLPAAGDVAITGLYYLLPIVVLIWAILPTPEKLSPALAASWACFAMIAIALTQHPLKAMFRGETDRIRESFMLGVRECFEGMVAGSRSMISIAVATGAAGVIVGALSLTGMHNVILEFVEVISAGNLLVLLVLVAVMSLILGMGLPTTANYIVVSALMAPVIVTLGAKSGLIIPLVAAHLFVFYFGILADDTPPVGLAAFAAAAISGGDPIKTGIQGFMYDIRTALLPFLFIFNTDILLIDVSFGGAILVFCSAVIAMMLFAAATQGYFFAKSYWWESLVLLLVAFTLFRPGFWLDLITPEFDLRPGTEIVRHAEKQPKDGELQIVVKGPNINNPKRIDQTTLVVPLGKPGKGVQRLEKAGLMVTMEGNVAKLEEPTFASKFVKLAKMFDFYGDKPVQIETVMLPNPRMPKELFYIPGLLLLGLIILLQRRRQTQPAF
ncbi:MAG: TRAP transporter permease [Hyphomicrobiaceae bacterium]|nr:TRAP transporter permease [Hyphomicrobiaceae bacterium]